MNFYKILNESECHHGFQFKTGLNVDTQPFAECGSCVPGGIYFSREDILAFIDYGPWIRKVSLPEGTRVVKDPGKGPVKWRADQVWLGRKYKLTANRIEKLIKEGANIHAKNDYALRWASECGHVEVVKVLLKHGADVHAWDDWALRLASRNGHVEVVKILLKHGADVHACNDEAFRWASRKGHVEAVKVLKEAMKKQELIH